MQNPEVTILSQYGQSPVINALIGAFNQWIDPSSNIDQFYSDIWDIDTATGIGLDIWGRIVGVGRVLKVNTAGGFFGFAEAGNVSANPFNSAPFYSGQLINSNYILNDAGYRTLILAKALANICDGSIQAINQILVLLFPGRGNCYVVDGLNMTMQYVFTFALSPVEAAIVGQSGILPRMTGVSSTVNILN
jgi:hypothetical protein